MAKNTLQNLLSKSRKAIQDFNLIQDGDKIAIGLSGGKDSMALLHVLSTYRRFSPEKFELMAICLQMSYQLHPSEGRSPLVQIFLEKIFYMY